MTINSLESDSALILFNFSSHVPSWRNGAFHLSAPVHTDKALEPCRNVVQ